MKALQCDLPWRRAGWFIQALTGAYLGIVLIIWPLLVTLWKCVLGGSWRSANRHCWTRWNEIRVDPFALSGPAASIDAR